MGERATLPDGFKLSDWLQAGGGDFGSEGQIDLELNINNSLAVILMETPLTPEMTIEPWDEHQHRITARLENTWQLRWWLLSQGYNLMVVNPPHLAQWLEKSHRIAANRYREELTNDAEQTT